MMAEAEQRRQYHQQEGDEGSLYSEPTPVPNEYRPPPPTFRQASLRPTKLSAARGGGYENNPRNHEASLLNSTLLSLSVDDGGTLPSLTFSPPSPLSQPSQSIFDDHKQDSSVAAPSQTTADVNDDTTKTDTPPSALSMARRRRQQRVQNVSATTSGHSQPSQRSGSGTKNPPMQEVYMNENQPNSISNSSGGVDKPYRHISPNSGESDNFFECVEDRSLANRARMTLQQPSEAQSSSPGRSVLSSLDGQPSILLNHHYSGQRLENIQETTIGSGDVVRVHESALNALQQLKEELVKANQRNGELTRERETWKEEEQLLRQEVVGLRTADRQKDTELQRLREDQERLKGDKDTTETERSELAEEKRTLEAHTRESTRTIKEYRHRILAGDNRHKELKGQLDKVNVELESALSKKGDMAAEIAQAQTERMELESGTETLRKQLAEATQKLDQSDSKSRRLQEELTTERKKYQDLRASSEGEIGRLNSSLRKANEALHRLKAELTPKVRSAMQHHGDGMQMQHQNNSMRSSTSVFPEAAPSLDSAIADRMARLRDSAERAHLIRAHKRDLARVKSDRDSKIRELKNDHTDALKKLTKQLDTKRKSELEAQAKTLNEEHESHLEEVEEEHEKRVSQLQKDFGRTQEDTDESMEEALNKIARLTQDHGREKGRRFALEKTVEDLQRKTRVQLSSLQAKHGSELEKRKKQFDSEKEILLGNVQRECNNAFAANRRRGNNNINTANNNNNSSSNFHVVETADALPTQLQGHGYRPPTLASQHQQQRRQQQQQHQRQTNGPSPLSMNSAPFFSETKHQHLKVIAPAGPTTAATTVTSEAAYIVPSPKLASPPIEIFRGIGGSPSVISNSYSDIGMDMDSVLRETELLVQSIL